MRSELSAEMKLRVPFAADPQESTNLSFSVLLTKILFLFVVSISGIVSAPAQITFGGPDDRFLNDADRIHQGDLIEVDVVGSFEFDWRGTLNPEGFIDGMERLPEPIYARCRSTAQVANSIAEGFRKVLRDPVVEVRIIDRNGRALSFIDGAVRTPLRLRVKRDLFLHELIVLAGGFTDLVGDEVSLFRPITASCEGSGKADLPNRPVTRVIKIKDLLAGVEGTNFKIVPGDVVTVVESLPIYVIGGVGSPQRISARAGITLTRAIDAAGGITKKGRTGSVTVYRRKGADAKVFEIDLAKVRSGADEDMALEANDIVEVPLRGEEKRKFPPMIERRTGDRSQIPLRIIE
jgi:polysaccharide biosynthesis/export protein